MQGVLSLPVVRMHPPARLPAEAMCRCPVLPLEGTWEQVLSEVEEGLEAMRREEIARRGKRLGNLSSAQRQELEHFTRQLLEHAVLDRLRRAARTGAGMARDVRAMFAGRP